jgi:hypothetical protein
MGTDWKGILGGIAPTIATALGGPAAGGAVKFLAEKFLGKPNASEAEVAAAIAGATPEQLATLKKLDQDYMLGLLDKAAAADAVDAGDRANARARETSLKDWTPQVLALITFAAFFTLLFIMVHRSIPIANQQAFNILLGVLAGAVTQVLNYYFGSSSGSAAARDVIGRIAETK